MNFIPRSEAIWKEVRYIKTPLGGEDHTAHWSYKLKLPEPLCDWDVFSYWERERVASMEKHLDTTDILFDVGTEQGWCNIVYAKIVGPENIFLIEPTQVFWPNIKAIWEENFGDRMPLGTYSGLVGDKTVAGEAELSKGWPKCADGDLVDRNSYTYIHDNQYAIEQRPIDDLVDTIKKPPTAITIDVEGAELLVLRGAEKTLRNYKPKLWVSIHPDLGLASYNLQPNEVQDYLAQFGYVGEHLATDHEEHWYFEVK